MFFQMRWQGPASVTCFSFFNVSRYEILTGELRRRVVAQGKFEPQQPGLPMCPEGERAAPGLSRLDLWGSWAAPSKS